jgi:hypothetical protein
MTIKVTGDYIDKIFIHFGSLTAFTLGAKLAAGFVSKHPISILRKIGTVVESGAACSATFQKVNEIVSSIKGKMSGKKYFILL